MEAYTQGQSQLSELSARCCGKKTAKAAKTLDKPCCIVYSRYMALYCPECYSDDLTKRGVRTWYRTTKEPALKTKRAYLCRACGRTTVSPKRKPRKETA